jgi:hypothetical protein
VQRLQKSQEIDADVEGTVAVGSVACRAYVEGLLEHRHVVQPGPGDLFQAKAKEPREMHRIGCAISVVETSGQTREGGQVDKRQMTQDAWERRR